MVYVAQCYSGAREFRARIPQEETREDEKRKEKKGRRETTIESSTSSAQAFAKFSNARRWPRFREYICSTLVEDKSHRGEIHVGVPLSQRVWPRRWRTFVSRGIFISPRDSAPIYVLKNRGKTRHRRRCGLTVSLFSSVLFFCLSFPPFFFVTKRTNNSVTRPCQERGKNISRFCEAFHAELTALETHPRGDPDGGVSRTRGGKTSPRVRSRSRAVFAIFLRFRAIYIHIQRDQSRNRIGDESIAAPAGARTRTFLR